MQWYGERWKSQYERTLVRNLTRAAITLKAAVRDTISRPGRRSFVKGGRTDLAGGRRIRKMDSALRRTALARAKARSGKFGGYGEVFRRRGISGAKLRFGKSNDQGERNLLGISIASRPGEPPRRQTGDLWRRMAHEVDAPRLLARVGTNLKYATFLERGTGPRIITRKSAKVLMNPETGEVFGPGPIRQSGMKPRPFMRPTMDRMRSNIAAIVKAGL